MARKSTRSIECELLIDAEPGTVWEAFTSAEEIVNWFALRSESEPGVGGFIELGWDLKSVEPGRCVITAWSPGEYLRMTWRDRPGGEHELPVEVWLERHDGGTRLRLVHSGFLSDASWDEEYDAHARGWGYELRSLRYYLERWPGLPRRHLLRKFPVRGNALDAWRRVVGDSAAFDTAGRELTEGAGFLLGLPDGSTTAAELIYATRNRDFVAAAAILDGGLFRIAFETLTDIPEIWIWAFSWTLSEQGLREVAGPLLDRVAERLDHDESKE